MIPVAPGLTLDERELVESFVRASGPGGQNVNKVNSAVQLRFDARGSPSLPDAVRERLLRLAGHRLTADGVVVITARRHRSQDRNRQDALERLLALLREAAVAPVRRRETAVSYGQRRRRLEAKGRRSAIKAGRAKPVE